MDEIALADTIRFEHVALVAVRFDESDEVFPEALASIELPPVVASAFPRRRKEFAAGRYCAQRAIAHVDASLAQTVVGIGSEREPVWPAALVGSITHTRGLAAAMVSRRERHRGVAIDIERSMDERAPARIGAKIVQDDELISLARAARWPEHEALTLVFSAKECIYKALFGEVQRYFGFHAARVTSVDTAKGSWRAVITERLAPSIDAGFECEGRFTRDGDVWVTTMAW